MKWFCIPLLFLFPTLVIFSNDQKPKVTFLIAEREYLTEETLPRFAKSHLDGNYHIQYCEADKEGNGRHILRNTQEITGADLLFISVRRRAFDKNVIFFFASINLLKLKKFCSLKYFFELKILISFKNPSVSEKFFNHKASCLSLKTPNL